MAKAKAKAKAKGKARAKARGGPPGAPLAPVLRRPAGRDGGALPPGDPLKAWEEGKAIDFHLVPLEKLGKGVKIVVEAGSYFQSPCKIAGEITGVEIAEDEVWIRLMVCGTTHEGILRLQSGQPSLTMRVHRCRAACGQTAVGEDMVHCQQARLLLSADLDEGWTRNLEKVALPSGEDEMRQLREAAGLLGPGAPGVAGAVAEAEKKEDVDKKDAKTKKKKKDKKRALKRAKKKKEKVSEKKKKEKEPKAETVSSSSEESHLDGRCSKQAAVKNPQVMFAGTGLDQEEKVRARVLRRAKRALRKKGDKADSSSDDSSGSGSSVEDDIEEEALFTQSNRVKLIADRFPGALTCQALAQMRASLFQEQGADDQEGQLRPAAVPYYRQHLARRLQGPAQREMLTLCTALDLLIKGRASAACDVLTQRLKSGEATASGSHWTVSQRMEVLGQEGLMIAGVEEISLAQKSVYADSKTRQLASQPEGRSRFGKGAQKGKEEKGNPERNWDRRGKGKGGRGKDASKKDETKTA